MGLGRVITPWRGMGERRWRGCVARRPFRAYFSDLGLEASVVRGLAHREGLSDRAVRPSPQSRVSSKRVNSHLWDT